jgi:hypothetical protein
VLIRRASALAALVAIAVAVRLPLAAQSLPAAIGDAEYWAMIERFSEPGGTFVSDNTVSNEIAFQHVIPALRASEQGAYIGVGPEQNFTYITSLRPRIAFIVDIRRQNLLLHLVYKALVEISTDRTDFMSRLFARPRPGGTGPHSTARALFAAFGNISPSEPLAQANLRDLLGQLKDVHRFPLSDDDERGIAEAYRALYLGGPELRGNFGGGSWIPSYAELMAQTDLAGESHSFMASEETFERLREYQLDNLIVPVVGDFSGAKAIRAIARYLKEHGATVTTFYASNVEEYLFKSDSWESFVRNVEALPVGQDSMLIRTYFTREEARLRTLLDPIPAMLDAFTGGRIRSYADVVLRSKAP